MSRQDGDVKLFQTLNDGDITITNGLVELSGGLETAFYLSMFGGNEDDSGLQDDSNNWWGNIGENEPSKQYRSETQYLIRSLPLTVPNLRRVADAVNRDLSWAIPSVAKKIDVTVTAVDLNRINISILVDGDGSLEFAVNWLYDIDCSVDDTSTDVLASNVGGPPPPPPGPTSINSLEPLSTEQIIDGASASIQIPTTPENIETVGATIEVLNAGMGPLSPKATEEVEAVISIPLTPENIEGVSATISIIDAGFLP